MRIRYVDQGSGSPIILVHGFTRTLEKDWLDTGALAKLAATHRVIAVDLRGHGKSGKPHDADAYGEDLQLDVIRLMDHLNIARAHMVGHSAGCSVVGRLAVTHPQRVITAILGAGTILHGVWEPSDDEDAKESAADVKSIPPFRNMIIRLTPRDEPPRSEATIHMFSAQLTDGNDLDALMAFRLAGGRGQLSSDEAVKAIKVPVLAIVGDQDPTVASVRNFQKFLPSVRVVEIKGATHGGDRMSVRRPEFIDAVLQFVAQHN